MTRKFNPLQNVTFCYTQYINSRKKQIGHLFQSRYKASRTAAIINTNKMPGKDYDKTTGPN
jgi:hypothetical protein